MVFDEAHNVADSAEEFSSYEISSKTLIELFEVVKEKGSLDEKIKEIY